MRLYLSSFRIGAKPEALLNLLGTGRRTALIYNACDFLTSAERAESLSQEVQRLESIGLQPSEVDLRNYFGGADGLEEALLAFDLLWVRGGNAFVLRRALRQSRADDIIKAIVQNDSVVYGGYSAGPCVLAPSLRGLELVDHPTVVPDGYESPVIWEGLGLLPFAFAPHYKSPDHPESAAVDNVVDYYVAKHIPFIALVDGEALVIQGDKKVVVGVKDGPGSHEP